MTSPGHQVGRIVGLWRYPVKSMRGESLPEIDVSWHGFAGDRRWAFIRDGAAQSGFPWLTLRDRGDMSHYRPSFAEPSRPDKSATLVQTPSGATYDVADPELAAQLGAVRAIKHDRGIFDTFPLSLITTNTITRLGEMVGTQLEAERFRPNLLVETTAPFSEDHWVGCILRVGGVGGMGGIGGSRIRIDKRDGRCAVITIDPATTERNPAILRAVAQERQNCLGVYGSTVEPGRIAINDPIVIESPA
jgi:uncharacterized protein